MIFQDKTRCFGKSSVRCSALAAAYFPGWEAMYTFADLQHACCELLVWHLEAQPRIWS